MIGPEPPHDGQVIDDCVYFTTVTGDIVALDGPTRGRRRRDVCHIAEIAGVNAPLGWCRGLKLLDEGRTALVGFTRLRKTRLRRNLAWFKNQVQQGGRLRWPGGLVSAGIMLVRVDLAEGKVIRHIDLEPHGLNAVFSIHDAAWSAAGRRRRQSAERRVRVLQA